MTRLYHEWDDVIFYFIAKLDTNIQKSTFWKKVVALFYIVKVLNFMRWTTLVKISLLFVQRSVLLLKHQTSFFHVPSVVNIVVEVLQIYLNLQIPSPIDLSSGLLFYLFLYELQKLSHTFCPPRVDRDQMSKQINILHILILNVDLTSFYEWEGLQSDILR